MMRAVVYAVILWTAVFLLLLVLGVESLAVYLAASAVAGLVAGLASLDDWP